ncbi:hypothetical protein D3C80_1605930 [compost metagenome]
MFIGGCKEIEVFAADIKVVLRSVGQVNHFSVLFLVQGSIGLLLAHQSHIAVSHFGVVDLPGSSHGFICIFTGLLI